MPQTHHKSQLKVTENPDNDRHPLSRSPRSPTPKFSFSSPQKTKIAGSSGNGINSIRFQVIRRLSNIQPAHSNDEDSDEDEEVNRRRSVGGKTTVYEHELDVSSYRSYSDHETDFDNDNSCEPSEEELSKGGEDEDDMKEIDSATPPSKGEAIRDSQSSFWRRLREDMRKVDWEIPRKSLHSSIGFITLYLYTSGGTPKYVILGLSSALCVIVPADVLRLNYPAFARVYERCLGFLMRESEKKTANGVIWYILGVNFALSVYPLDVATVSILILSWADTAASTVGRLFGAYSPKLPRRSPILRLPFAARKSLAGFLAASITGAVIAMGFWLLIAPVRPNDMTWSFEEGVVPTLGSTGLGAGSGGGSGKFGGWLGLTVIGIFAGLVSGVAEALDVGSLDDNLTLPIISGGCLLGLFELAGLFAS